MGKKIVIFLCVLSMIYLTACGTSGTSGTSGTIDKDEVIKIRVAMHHPQSHVAFAAMERIKAKIEAESNGGIELTIYPGNQLGDYSLVYEEVMKGSIEMAHIYIPSQYDPMLEIAAIPYLVDDYASMKKVFTPGSYFYDKYEGIHHNLGVKLLGIYADGFIGYGTKDLPENYNDVSAEKTSLIRIPGSDVYQMTTEDMGYPSTTIAYADLYSALQTGVADGWVGGTSLMNYLQFKDAIDYFINYKVFMENSSYIINEELFDSLSDEYQKIIVDAVSEESLNSFDTCKDMDDEGNAGLTEYGVEVIDLTPEEMGAYAKHIREITWPKLAEKFGQDVMDGLRNDVK